MSDKSIDRIIGDLILASDDDIDGVFYGTDSLKDDIVDITDYLLDPHYGQAIDQDDRVDALRYIESKLPIGHHLSDIEEIYVLTDNVIVKIRSNNHERI